MPANFDLIPSFLPARSPAIQKFNASRHQATRFQRSRGDGHWHRALLGCPRCADHAGPSNADETPIIDALLKYAEDDDAPLHIPGHKRGAGMPPALARVLGRDSLRYDLTELPGLDNLAAPAAAIRRSQAAAARAFGAERTWYLVNGTSVGLQAAVMATCSPRAWMFVARNCHASVSAAMVLADVSPWWLLPEHDPVLNISHGITPGELRARLEAASAGGQTPKAVLVVSPTYFGACSDIGGLAVVCHKHGLPLIVDEAHGAHLGLAPGFPPSAMQQGADISVQSTHKTLNSLGQASMLHARGNLVDFDRLAECLRLLQTTSPSYLLLASLDAAQAYARSLAREGPELPLAAVQAARQALDGLQGISLLESATYSAKSVSYFDPWRITVDVHRLGVTGFEAEAELQDRFGVYPEMATHMLVVFALGPGTQQSHLDSLVRGLRAMSEEHTALGRDSAQPPPLSTVAELRQREIMAPREAFYAAKQLVPFNLAEGRRSGELLCPYPPGVPVAFPGEKLTRGTLALLREVIEAGGVVTGATDASLQKLLVIEEPE